MGIKQQGGIFGRNPTFNDVTVDGTLTVNGEPISDFGTMAQQDADSVNIDGGAIDGTAIGANAASTGDFTDATADQALFNVTTDRGTGAGMVSEAIGITGPGSYGIEMVTRGSGTFTTITVGISLNSSSESVLVEVQMACVSDGYLDYLVGGYSSGGTPRTIRNNNGGTAFVSAVSSGNLDEGTYQIVFTFTSITHPHVRLKVSGGRQNGGFVSQPTVTFA